MSKTDPQALGTTCAWGCIFGTPALPCPYHLARVHFDNMMDFADTHGTRLGVIPEDMPLFCTLEGGVPRKPAMIATFEELGKLCGQPTLSREGLRLFGGHTARVTGAQALAAAGVEFF